MTTENSITVLGAKGWIGSALVAELKGQGRSVRAITRKSLSDWLSNHDSYGPVIYTIGLTSDFRHRPHETVEAHVSLLSQVLRRPGIEKLVLLSSTRVYARALDTSETTILPCLSSDPSDIYNISKLLGEALLLQDSRPGLKVVRLSNVVGPGQPPNTFLGALLAEATAKGSATIVQPEDTSKNYVALDDVVRLLPAIAERGRQRIYNLGSDRNSSHREVALWLMRQGVNVRFASRNETRNGLSFSPLVIDRLSAEFESPSCPFS
ncbi:NAD-dependent epimerase/dehydratase family protein [Synechococcus sp. MIT S1220]|uniref:NAD-dependent epimerase/dehydratase family protein n=1 Tax=Synechococcus sp. MIT S1220 TaxID=3082549 RepID=UPI0039B00718